MKKDVQLWVNGLCETEYELAIDEYMKKHGVWKRLRTCTAEVCETENYYVLRSYNTIVAVINKASDTLVDLLRYVYGYTSTSAQHIRKFSQDYGKGKWRCSKELRWYAI